MATGARTRESEAHAVRRADAADLSPLTRMLVRAFMDDPVAVWACKWDRLRPKMLEGMYQARLRQMLLQQEIWTNPGRSSAALWVPPERWKTTLRQDAALVRCFLNPRLMARLPLLAVGLSGVQRKHPRQPPHWYLSLLGTDPDAQGHGFGSAVLQPVLEQCDIDGVGAYLESSKQRNLDFYARYGFRITGEIRLPYGPTMWPMWRDPRP
jgi:ribosomal protein S18 acetylase RimI-like enzyme